MSNSKQAPGRRMENMNVKTFLKDNTLKRLLGFLFKYYKKPILLIMICIIIASAVSITSSIFVQQILENVVNPALKDGSMENHVATLLVIGVVMGVVYLLGILATTIYTQIVARVGQDALNRIRKEMFDKMETLPIKYFDTHAHGDIMSYYTNDVDSLRQFITQSLVQIFQISLTLVFVIITMLYYSLYLFLIVFLCAFIMLRVTKSFGGKSAKYFIKQQKSTADCEGYIEEMMNGLKVVKVFTHESKAKEDFDKINEQLCKDSTTANYYGNIMMPILGNIGNIFYVLVAVVGVLLAIFKVPNIGLISLSAITTHTLPVIDASIVVAFLMMTRSFTQNINQISQQVSMAAMALAGTKRVLDLIDEKPEEDEGYVTLVNAKYNEKGELEETTQRTEMWAWKHPHKADNSVTLTKLCGDIILDDVDFGYNPEKIVLHNVDIYAKPGQKIAFVGATGAGKTTITNLINRFYDIQDGKIRYDGININKIKKSDLRRSLGIVLQDTNLFTGTVMENIRYGRLDATDEEVYEAAKIANAYDFITRLPEGFNTMLTSDGANLSQGQRQLISIARAAVADTPVMILDEATSSIDTRTELLVQKGTDKLMEGRTVFVIAHRLSTVQNSDAIMVLDHGRIIERGNHESLIKQKGTYYQLYTGAFELE